jgi:hypothetical protein
MTTSIEPQKIRAAVVAGGATTRKKYVPAVGPRLKVLLSIILAVFAVLSVNSVYLVAIRLLDWRASLSGLGVTYQNWFSIAMLGLHIALGLLIILPVIVFGAAHMRNARNRPNRRAIRAGYALFAASLVLLFTGVLLTRSISRRRRSAVRCTGCIRWRRWRWCGCSFCTVWPAGASSGAPAWRGRRWRACSRC